MDSCAVKSTLVTNWTEQPPAFSFKINKLSDFLCESPFFSSGGYNWRLLVYPNGGNDDGGYIAMFVELDSTSLTSKSRSEVFAYITFFIYSKKESKYFTHRVVEVIRFNAKSTCWGVANVLPSIFKEEECEFGVDVMVVSPFTEGENEITSFDEKLTCPKFSWNVKNFSELNEFSYSSNRFSMGGREWTLELYPKGDSVEVSQWLSLFLNLAEDETQMADEKFFVEANLRIIDPRGSNHTAEKIIFWYTQSGDGCGCDRFLPLAKLREEYLDMEGSLNVEVEFEVVSTTKYSPII